MESVWTRQSVNPLSPTERGGGGATTGQTVACGKLKICQPVLL